MHIARWNKFPSLLQFLLCCWPQPQHGVQLGPPATPGWVYKILQPHQENITLDGTAAGPVLVIADPARMSLFQVCLVSASKESQVSGSAQEDKQPQKLLPFLSTWLPSTFF